MKGDVGNFLKIFGYLCEDICFQNFGVKSVKEILR